MAERFEQYPFDDNDWKNVEAGSEREYLQAGSFVKKSLSKERKEDFHAWRKNTKALYYQLYLIASAWPKHIRKFLKSLQELHGKLGGDHDLVILRKLLRKAPVDFGKRFEVTRIIRILKQRNLHLQKRSFSIRKESLNEKSTRFTCGLENISAFEGALCSRQT